MKKLFAILSILSFSSFAFAISDSVYLSSNTATADTTKALCQTAFFNSTPRGVVHTACVNTGTAGTFTLYNSSGTSANPVAAIDTAAKGCQNFDVILSSGITYTNSATANVTLTYQCF